MVNRSHRPVGRKSAGRAGFTLLELLVVMAILAIIATLVTPRLFGQLEKSQVTTAQTQVKMLRSALDTLRLDIGRFPTEQEGLSLLVEPPDDSGLKAAWFGPYIDGSVPNDPWGNPYLYKPPSGPRGVPEVISHGADGAPGGEGLNADISSTT